MRLRLDVYHHFVPSARVLRRLEALEQKGEHMSQEFDDLTREVAETKDEAARLSAAADVYEAAFKDLKAQVEAMKNNPTPAQLAALSETLDQVQADSAAARAKVDAALAPAAEEPPPADQV